MSGGLWGAFDVRDWMNIPSISGRIAEKVDVEAGCAVFYFENPEELRLGPYDLGLPHCGLLTDEETDETDLVVLIQAEQADDRIYVGYRLPNGGNGMCFLYEV